MNSATENYENFKVLEHLIGLRIGLRSAVQNGNTAQERRDLKQEIDHLRQQMDNEKVIQDAIEFHKNKYQAESVIFESQYRRTS
jgi:hypothetical protein